VNRFVDKMPQVDFQDDGFVTKDYQCARGCILAWPHHGAACQVQGPAAFDGGEIGVTITPEPVVPPELLEKIGGESKYSPEEIAREKFYLDTMDVYDNARDVLFKKHKDYGPTNISLSPGGPLNGLRVRMHDKLARINNLIDSGATPENESLRDSFLDLMNYAAIAQVVLDGNWPER
jgi:hypothetical protein